jgi:hypothetical protein
MSGHDRADREQHRAVKSTTPDPERAATDEWPVASSEAASTERKAEAGDMTRPDPGDDVIRHLQAHERGDAEDDNEEADRRARVTED